MDILYDPDIFKVYTTDEGYEESYYVNGEKRTLHKHLIRYFYPGDAIIELTSSSKGYNEFTKACDEYRLGNYIPEYPMFEEVCKTYLYNAGVTVPSYVDANKVHTFADIPFRTPGATRGHLVVDIDTQTIIDVVFNEYTCFDSRIGCYDKGILELVDKFKNTKYKVDRISDIVRIGDAL